jgi:single-stranded DNA-binding protein
MLNQVVLVGKLFWVYETGITLEVQRSFKNNEGQYDVDIISVELPEDLYNTSKEYLNSGKEPMVAVKARLISEGDDHSVLKLTADRISFLK